MEVVSVSFVNYLKRLCDWFIDLELTVKDHQPSPRIW